MKTLVVCVALLAGAQASAAIRPFGDGERIAFLGDSITHGGGYVADLQIAWKVRHPESRPVFLNAGIGGDTAKRGYERIEADLVPMRPDRVIIMFGMNDVLSGGLPFYKEWMVKLCDALDKKGWKVDLMTPSPYDEWNTNLTAKVTKGRQEPALGNCAAFVRELAAQRGYGVVELHDPMVELVKAHPERKYMPDRVHPGTEGHLVMAALILEAAGEGRIDPKDVVPNKMGALRDRLLGAQTARRGLAVYERLVREKKVDIRDKEAVFAVLDERLAALRKSISVADAKWHEGQHENFKKNLYGRNDELQAREEACREDVFTFDETNKPDSPELPRKLTDVRYTEYPGIGHDVWEYVYNDNAVLDWLFAQRR